MPSVIATIALMRSGSACLLQPPVRRCARRRGARCCRSPAGQLTAVVQRGPVVAKRVQLDDVGDPAVELHQADALLVGRDLRQEGPQRGLRVVQACSPCIEPEVSTTRKTLVLRLVSAQTFCTTCTTSGGGQLQRGLRLRRVDAVRLRQRRAGAVQRDGSGRPGGSRPAGSRACASGVARILAERLEGAPLVGGQSGVSSSASGWSAHSVPSAG